MSGTEEESERDLEPQHEPSLKFNPYDGYRVQERKVVGQETASSVLSLASYGDGREMFSVPVCQTTDSLEGQALLSRQRSFLLALASYLNCCGTLDEVESMLAALRPVVEQVRIEPPEDWQFYAHLGASELSDQQYLFFNESTGMVLIVAPDTYAEESPIERVANDFEEEGS